MIDNVVVVGAGRAGSVLASRLAAAGASVRTAGRELDVEGADVVLLCVPDREIAPVAAALEPGPWVAHVSGATRLSALDPHVRRFALHPLQSFAPGRGPEQLDGVFAAIGGETTEALETARELAALLDLTPFELDDEKRALYHAGAVFASNYLVTLHAAAGELMTAAGAPEAALEPLMRGVLESGFLLNGPIARSDWATVESHLLAIRKARPRLEPLYRVLVEATLQLVVWRRPSALDAGEPSARRSWLSRRLAGRE